MIFETDLGRLYQGDCLELLPDVPDNSVDMVLCDLPYGLTQNLWDKVVPLEPLWEQYKRVCKRNAAIVLFSQMPFTVDLINSNRKLFRYEWIYHKVNRSGFLNARRMPLKVHENILVFYEALPTYNPQFFYDKPYKEKAPKSLTSNYRKDLPKWVSQSLDGRRYPIDIIKFNNGSLMHSQTGSWHPTQKPVDLCEYLVKTYTNEGETVLDNCMGGGTTCVACVNTGRRFIGMELMPEYFETAKRRVTEGEPKPETVLTEVGEQLEMVY